MSECKQCDWLRRLRKVTSMTSFFCFFFNVIKDNHTQHYQFIFWVGLKKYCYVLNPA